MKTGTKIVQEFSRQDLEGECLTLQEMIDIAMKDAVNDKLQQAKIIINAQALDDAAINRAKDIIDMCKV